MWVMILRPSRVYIQCKRVNVSKVTLWHAFLSRPHPAFLPRPCGRGLAANSGHISRDMKSKLARTKGDIANRKSDASRKAEGEEQDDNERLAKLSMNDGSFEEQDEISRDDAALDEEYNEQLEGPRILYDNQDGSQQHDKANAGTVVMPTQETFPEGEFHQSQEEQVMDLEVFDQSEKELVQFTDINIDSFLGTKKHMSEEKSRDERENTTDLKQSQRIADMDHHSPSFGAGARSQTEKKSSSSDANKLKKRGFFRKLPKSQPFSIPEPHLYPGETMEELRYRNEGKKDEEIPVPTWYADQAAPPLLLTLDAFDTLYTPKRPIADQYAEVAQKLGYKVIAEQVQELFKTAFRAVSAEYPLYGIHNIQYKRWWGLVIEKTFESVRPAQKQWPDSHLNDSLFELFSTRKGYRLFSDTEQLLSRIGTSWQARLWPPKRTMLGIVSNSDPRVTSILDSFGIKSASGQKAELYPPRFAPEHRNDDPKFPSAQFAFSTLSYNCGWEKPNPSIYKKALGDASKTLNRMSIFERLTRSGKDVLTSINEEFHHMHVGDSLEKDVIPALTAGWDAVLLDRSATHEISEQEVSINDKKQGQKTCKYFVINSLMRIPDIVTKDRLTEAINSRVGREVYRKHPYVPIDPLKTLDLSKLRSSSRKRRDGKGEGSLEEVEEDALAHQPAQEEQALVEQEGNREHKQFPIN